MEEKNYMTLKSLHYLQIWRHFKPTISFGMIHGKDQERWYQISKEFKFKGNMES